MGSLLGWNEITYLEYLGQSRPSGNVFVSTERVLGGCFFCDSLSYLPMGLALALCPVSFDVGGGKRISFMFKVSEHRPGPRPSSLEDFEGPQSNESSPCFPPVPCSAILLEHHVSSSLAASARLLLKAVTLLSQCLSALACVLNSYDGYPGVVLPG